MQPITDTITVKASDTYDNDSLADLVADVNKAIADSDLSGKIIARVAGSRIEFVSLAEDNPLREGDQSVAFRIVPTGTGAAELGLELDGAFWLDSKNVDGVQVLPARSATRYAIAEPVVTPADKLSIGATRVGAIERGDIIHGVADTSYPDGNFLDPGDAITGTTAVVLDVQAGFSDPGPY